MEFVDKYLMPHKGKIAGLVVLDIMMDLPQIRGTALELVLGFVALLLFIWIGFQGRRKLNYAWMDSAKAGALIGAIMAFVDILVLPIINWLIAPSAPWQYSATLWAVLALIGMVVDVLMALIGHVIAKFFPESKAAAQQVAAQPAARSKLSAAKRKH